MRTRTGILLAATLVILLPAAARADALTPRQSIGQGNFTLGLNVRHYESDYRLTESNAFTVASWNGTYKGLQKRDVTMLRGSFGLFDRVDVFGGVGVGREDGIAVTRTTGAHAEKQSGAGNFALEGGLKGTLLRFAGQGHLAGLIKVEYWETGENYHSYDNARVTWRTMDAELEVGYAFGGITPYLGGSFAEMRAEQRYANSRSELKNNKRWGTFIGFSTEVTDSFSFGGEGTFGSREGFSLNASYEF